MTPLEVARQNLPLPKLIHLLTGKEVPPNGMICSPFREEKRPSFSVFQGDDGRWRWKDFSGGADEFGDEVDFLAKIRRLPNEAALEEFLKLAKADTPHKNGTLPSFFVTPARAQPPTNTLTPWDATALHQYRGYSLEFCSWATQQLLVVDHNGNPAIPVYDGPHFVGLHVRTPQNWWIYEPKGTRITPFVYSPTPTPEELHIFESQWDMLAVMDALHVHEGHYEHISFAATRGAANGKLAAQVLEQYPSIIKIYAWPQNDPINAKTGKAPSEEWLKDVAAWVAEKGHKPYRVVTPAKYKDANDWLKEAKEEEFSEAIASAKKHITLRYTFESVAELITATFDNSDNFFGDRIIAAGQPVTFLGPGGVGKSRIMLQLAICMILGREFLGIPTFAKGKRWLVFQTENSRRRLHEDLKKMLTSMRIDATDAVLLKDNLIIHTIQKPEDSMMIVTNPEDFRAMSDAIEYYQPDFVQFDPLNAFCEGDLDKDKDMRPAVMKITELVCRYDRNRVPIVVHHSLTGKEGAAKAIGWDRASYGRNSKSLQAWTRAQVNISPRAADDPTRLIISCGKNNNGKPFPNLGVFFNENTWLYEIDPDFDEAEFREEVGIESPKRKSKTTYITPSIEIKQVSDEEVLKMIPEYGLTKKSIVDYLIEEAGLTQPAAYRRIDALLKAKKLKEVFRVVRGKITRFYAPIMPEQPELPEVDD
jgi:hypothetical protein